MLKAFDISNWQRGLDAASLPADIIICKATEGLNFVDKTCDGFWQAARKAGKLLGHYHFARNNNPEAEARFFWENTRNYSRLSVPILDIEDSSIPSWLNYATAFDKEYARLSGGVHPMIYASAGALSRFGQGGDLTKNCALWVAGYPTPAKTWPTSSKVPYSIRPWSIVTGWQFTSSFSYKGIKLDASLFYTDRDGWMKIAGAKEVEKMDEVKFPEGKPSALEPVWRLFNSRKNEHFWTISKAEAAALAREGWKIEGIAFFARAVV